MGLVLSGGSTMSARWVGQFAELTDRPDHPSMASVVNSASEAEAMAIADYLRSGHVLIDVLETRPDVLDGSVVEESSSVLGDGQWVWREDLAHYVAKYRLGLGQEFLSYLVGEVTTLDDSSLEQAVSEAMQLWQRG